MRYWLLALSCAAMAGCLTHKVAPTRYFLVEPATAPPASAIPSVIRTDTDAAQPETTSTDMPSPEPLPFTLGVRPFMTAKPYTQPITYLGEDQELVFRDRLEWAEPPADVITRAVRDALAGMGRFQDVGDAADMARPDLILTGEVRRFLENRTVTPPMAEVAVHIEVREARGVRLVWSGLLRASGPVHEATPGALAAAMSNAVARIAEDAARILAGVAIPTAS